LAPKDGQVSAAAANAWATPSGDTFTEMNSHSGNTRIGKAEGIYELGKDRLKLCWTKKLKTRGRPTKFAHAKEGNDPFLLVLIREKK
jgi:uncharacterized protein (TIGR03067 family)